MKVLQCAVCISSLLSYLLPSLPPSNRYNNINILQSQVKLHVTMSCGNNHVRPNDVILSNRIQLQQTECNVLHSEPLQLCSCGRPAQLARVLVDASYNLSRHCCLLHLSKFGGTAEKRCVGTREYKKKKDNVTCTCIKFEVF